MSIKREHLRVLSAFCVLYILSGCSDSDKHKTDGSGLDPNQNQPNIEVGAQATDMSDTQSLLTLQELLNASDVKLALAKAADEGNTPMLEYWQQELIKAATEVNLSKSELQLITGPQGLKYLEFQGMKTNYHNAFEQAFFNFQDLDAVYRAYPAFEDLHARSRALVEKRDQLILQVAEELKESGFEGDALEEARVQWQNYMLNKSNQDANNIALP